MELRPVIGGGWTVLRQNENGFWEDQGTHYGDIVGSAGHLVFSSRALAETFAKVIKPTRS